MDINQSLQVLFDATCRTHGNEGRAHVNFVENFIKNLANEVEQLKKSSEMKD